MKKIGVVVVLFIIGLFLVSCSSDEGDIKKVGMITDEDAENNPWVNRGFEGLQQIEEKYGVDVFFEENVHSEADVEKKVDEMVHRGVNLIFSQNSSYGKLFTELTKTYPNVHFVYFDGAYTNKRVSSIDLHSHAMSFFAGMIAAQMSTSNEVGIIAAHEWQGEIEGFFEGVKYEDPDAEIHMEFVKEDADSDMAADVYENMRAEDVDVFYPVWDSFSTDILNFASEDDVYAIGYLEDQSKIDPSNVLTSTIQDISGVYVQIADDLNEGELEGGVISFDFRDDVVELGEYSDRIPKQFQQEIESAVTEYVESDLLPYEE